MPYTVPEELNDQNGDIILRSSDQVEFRVFQWPLQHLYPVFSDMFHLPNPASLPKSSAPPTVQMDETAAVVEALLRLSYPIDPPIVQDICTMVPIIEAIIKLQAERRCKWWIRMTAVKLIPTNPWAMYAILLALGRKSCDYNLEEEIRIAARETLGRPIVRPWDEARLITAADYDRLLVYHSECKNAFLESQEEMWEEAERQWPWFSPHCSSAVTVRMAGSCLAVTQWFLDFRSRVKETFCKELRGEAIEDTSLWHDLLDIDPVAGELCHSCAMSCALQMPAYAKILAKLSEETISQVNRSSYPVKTRRMLMQMWLDKTNHQILNGKLPLDHLSPLSPLVSSFLSYCPDNALYNWRDNLFPISLTHHKKPRDPSMKPGDKAELCEGEMEALSINGSGVCAGD